MDRILLWLAWRLPRRLVYHCAVRLSSHAHPRFGKDEVVLLTMMEALRRWDVQYVVYRAKLDSYTCPNCEALDGMVFRIGSDEYGKHKPPLPNWSPRHGCLYLICHAEYPGQVANEDQACRCVYVPCNKQGVPYEPS